MNVESLDEDTVTLVPGKIEMIENKELTMYTIEKWELVYRDKNTNAGIKMTVVLTRKITNEMMTPSSPLFSYFSSHLQQHSPNHSILKQL